MKKVIMTLGFVIFSFCAQVVPCSAQIQSVQSDKVQEISVFSIGKIRMKFLALQRDINKAINKNMNQVKKGNYLSLGALLMFGFVYGIVHSVGPGHGKLLIISYFSAGKYEWIKGVWLGCQIALTHVLSAVVIVLSVKGVAQYVLYGNEQLQIKVVKIISYTCILLTGLYMIYTQRFKSEKPDCCSHQHSALFAASIGLTPCTGSLLVLLYAMARQQLWAGLLVVAAISTGIAVTLSFIGVSSIFLRNKVIRASQSQESEKCSDIIGYFGAFAVSILGAYLLYNQLF